MRIERGWTIRIKTLYVLVVVVAAEERSLRLLRTLHLVVLVLFKGVLEYAKVY